MRPQELLQQAVAHHQAGDFTGALARYQQVLALDPQHADALHLMAMALRSIGRTELAEKPARAALALAPDHPRYVGTLARIRRDLGHLDEAEQGLRRALALEPEHAATWTALGRVLRELDRPAEAETCHRQALVLDPRSVDAHTNLARVLLETGRIEASLAAARQALALRPGHLPAAINAALALAELGKLDEAVDALGSGEEPLRLRERARLLVRTERWREAALALEALAELAPRDTRTWWQLAQARHAAGEPLLALSALRQARRRDEEDPQMLRAHLDWLAALTPDQVGRFEENDLESLLADHRLPAQSLAPLAQAVWARRHGWLRQGTPPWPAALEALTCSLGRALLRRAQVRSPQLERSLLALRDRLLVEPDIARANLDALASLAWQGWLNEYAWGTLTAPHPLGLLGGAWPDGEVEPQADDPLHGLWVAQVVEPAEERRLAADIEELGDTDDAVTQAVRSQYEESPYPRWQGLAPRPVVSIPTLLDRLFPWMPWRPPAHDPLRVLLVGCGTGHHALLLASGLAHIELTALDLSRNSLGYAKRQAVAHGHSDIRFVRGDLLGLDALETTFDHVESVGVLHHLDRPADGLAALVRRMAPGATLKLGLYTRRSRREVVAGHAVVADLPRTAAGAREARQRILALPDTHPARPLVYSPDFYATSAVRDLILHACEHRFHPVEVGALLAQAGLELLGVEVDHPEAVADWDARFPDDPQRLSLAHWDQVESEHPHLFAGMIRVWARLGA